MKAPYHLLDVFTDQMFAGNQLAVFEDATVIDEALFQKIAGELNLSETVFLYPEVNGSRPMRIFTPQSELPTAGHPTIGTAHLLASQTSQSVYAFDQKVGRITVAVGYDHDQPGLIWMNQPLPEFGEIVEKRNAVAQALSLKESDLDKLPIQVISCGNKALLIPLKTESALAQIKVNTMLLASEGLDQVALYPFTLQTKTGDVKGRMFAPFLGIAEDPATGSANGPLACYLHTHTPMVFPAVSLQGFEMGRPSYLHLDVESKNDTITAVKVGGKAKIIGRGELFL